MLPPHRWLSVCMCSSCVGLRKCIASVLSMRHIHHTHTHIVEKFFFWSLVCGAAFVMSLNEKVFFSLLCFCGKLFSCLTHNFYILPSPHSITSTSPAVETNFLVSFPFTCTLLVLVLTRQVWQCNMFTRRKMWSHTDCYNNNVLKRDNHMVSYTNTVCSFCFVSLLFSFLSSILIYNLIDLWPTFTLQLPPKDLTRISQKL